MLPELLPEALFEELLVVVVVRTLVPVELLPELWFVVRVTVEFCGLTYSDPVCVGRELVPPVPLFITLCVRWYEFSSPDDTEVLVDWLGLVLCAGLEPVFPLTEAGLVEVPVDVGLVEVPVVVGLVEVPVDVGLVEVPVVVGLVEVPVVVGLVEVPVDVGLVEVPVVVGLVDDVLEPAATDADDEPVRPVLTSVCAASLADLLARALFATCNPLLTYLLLPPEMLP